MVTSKERAEILEEAEERGWLYRQEAVKLALFEFPEEGEDRDTKIYSAINQAMYRGTIVYERPKYAPFHSHIDIESFLNWLDNYVPEEVTDEAEVRE